MKQRGSLTPQETRYLGGENAGYQVTCLSVHSTTKLGALVNGCWFHQRRSLRFSALLHFVTRLAEFARVDEAALLVPTIFLRGDIKYSKMM